MKQIDLEPDEFRKKPSKLAISDAKLARNMLIVPIVGLVLAYFSFSWPSGVTQFFAPAMCGFLIGGMLVLWMKG